MSVKTFIPNPKYMTKQRLAFGLVALISITFFLFLAIPMSFDPDIGLRGGLIMMTVITAIGGVFILSPKEGSYGNPEPVRHPSPHG